MAAYGLGLCLILTLWMTGSRPPTAVPPRSLESSFWWGRESLDINARALAFRNSGDLHAAEQVYRNGYDLAVRHDDRLAATRFLMSAGGCQLLGYRYQAALSTFVQARDLAKSIGDSADLGAIAVNLSSIHLQMQDLADAVHSAEDGLAQANAPHASYFEPPLLLQLGWLHSLLGDGKEQPYFEEGIESARVQGSSSIEADGWDRLGEARLAAGDLSDAERAFLEAFRLRRLFLPSQVQRSYPELGALFLARGDLIPAEHFTSLAIQADNNGSLSRPRYDLLHQQGRIRLAQGQVNEALADFWSALESSMSWRREALPSRSSLTGLNVALDDQVFRTFIETAASHALETGSERWAERAFQALELNRSASLRESLALADVWRKRLPAEYWEILARLDAEEIRGGNDAASKARSATLHLRLTEMEAQAGIGLKPKKYENFLSRSSLIHFQEGLSDSELFLSFSLGKKESYLWAVSRTSIRLYRLAARQEIANAVQSFRAALPAGGTEATRRGRQLYQQLFGQVEPRERRTKAWLLSLEGTLFDVPFAALVAGQHGGDIVYLGDSHSVQIIPGALLLGAAGERRANVTRGFLGVGDPIYNTADQRWRGPQELTSSWEDRQLNRLVGSGKEIAASASSWSAPSKTVTLLTGLAANRTRFLEALNHRPAIIHLATHVIISRSNRAEGLVALGLRVSPNGAPSWDYLTTSEIAELRVPGALVVMSGCSTGIGEARAGAGLLGLTRAWLMAGAGAVVSTSWPQEDTSGEILARFYHYFHNHSAAEALRLSQMEVAHSGTWRAAPMYWASYQLTGGSR